MSASEKQSLILDFHGFGSDIPSHQRLQEHGYGVKCLGTDQFQNSNYEWEKECDLLHLPPGPYFQMKTALGIWTQEWARDTSCAAYRIKRYVEENGGKIFGICAGAMAMSSHFLYATPDGEVVSAGTELNIIDCRAIHYRRTCSMLTMAPFRWTAGTTTEAMKHVASPAYLQMPYWDGPCFIQHKDKDVKILGVYGEFDPSMFSSSSEISKLSLKTLQEESKNNDHTVPAIILKEFSRGGKALACGFHPECHTEEDVLKYQKWESDAQAKVKANTTFIKAIWDECMGQINA